MNNSDMLQNSDTLAESSNVVVRFEVIKAPYGNVSQIVNRDEDIKWNIKYFRRNFETSLAPNQS